MLKAHFAPRTIARIQARNADLGAIHAAKAQLGLAEADYRAMVSAACKGRSESSANLVSRERARLIKALVAKGYVEPANPSARTVELQQRRLRDLGLIHMGARALGMKEEDYRALVVSTSKGKARTSALLNAEERSKLLGAMKEKGFDYEAAAA